MSREPRWSAWEREVAEMFGGSVVVQSGRLPNHKGDVVSGGALVDCKYTDSGLYRLTRAMWDRLCEWAVNMGREPVVAVSLHGAAKVGVVRESAAKAMEPWYARDLGAGATRAIRPDTAPARFTLGDKVLYALPLERVAAGLSEGRL